MEKTLTVEDYEKYQINKKVTTIKDGSYKGLYEVRVTDNGHQWLVVFQGRLKYAKEIVKAYQNAGYKGDEE